jgi:hypothetical protein
MMHECWAATGDDEVGQRAGEVIYDTEKRRGEGDVHETEASFADGGDGG